ncbi:MAG: glycine cleavage system protein GcvH [Tenericutes bacterium]|jgi:glycine cleavage system H protein|nr:glycine cleavage system protein GcvH [Mycoplasmatota bacterium]
MSKILEGLYYSDDHEWVKVLEDDLVLVGVTDFAQAELGDVVFVDLPEEGDEIVKGEEFGAVESVKAASDLVAPISGEVIEVNEELASEPERVNQEPYEAWFLKVKLNDPKELEKLLDHKAYKEEISE